MGGSGFITPIVYPPVVPPGTIIKHSSGGSVYGVPATYLSLQEYCAFLQVPEYFFYGIRNHPDAITGMGCGDYWQQIERYWLAECISKAEHRLEADRWLGFPLRRRYERKPHQLPWAWPLHLNKYVRGMGIEAETDLQNAWPIVLSAGATIYDPVTFSIATTVTDIDELLLYYPGQRQYTIRPDYIDITSGVATFYVPRCRLLKPAYLIDYADVNDRPDYTDDDYFLNTIDVVRNYLDTSQGCNLVWHRKLSDTLGCSIGTAGLVVCDPANPCSDVKQAACGYVVDQRMGEVQLEPSTYSSGSWVKANYAIRRHPDMVEVNYMRGYYDRYDDWDEDIIRAVIALAHNNFPQDPCFKCSIQQQYYKRDVELIEPQVNFGLGPSTQGVFEAYSIVKEFDNKESSYHGGML